MEERRILHCFADMGVESETLSRHGEVFRVGLEPRDTNASQVVKADANALPFKKDSFSLGLFHPPCSRWSPVTAISGNQQDHPDLIELARELAEDYCDHWIIENIPRSPLEPSVVLEGGMFGLPIQYKRVFETSFPVKQPQVKTNLKPECSPYFSADRSREWWESVKSVENWYPKGHVAKNCLPAAYVEYLLQEWLKEIQETNARTSPGQPAPGEEVEVEDIKPLSEW